jgi:Tol biopolymer transport system component
MLDLETDPEHLQWSPDGRWIIYNTLHDANGDRMLRIERIPANDSSAAPEVVSGGPGEDAYKPTYTPDGRAIAFGCAGELCRMDADGSNVRTLVSWPFHDLNHPTWGRNPP